MTVRSSCTISVIAAAVLLSGSLLAQSTNIIGAVYTMTNDAAGNNVLAFHRSSDGSLHTAGSFATGGLGTSGGLGNQAGLVLSEDERWLAVVNAGSDEVSMFAVTRLGLALADRVWSGGIQPVSVTVHKNLLYVLNAGGTGNISGFKVGVHGTLSPLPGATKPLSQAGGTGAAQIAFSRDGNVLVVTEKATNRVVTYTVDKDGLPSDPIVHASSGPTPFGFDFGKRDQVLVTEANPGVPNGSSVSSYLVLPDGDLQVISASVPTGRTAACWLVVTNDGRYALTSNTPSDSISTFAISFDGSLTVRHTTVVPAGNLPLDSALTNDSRYFYVLNSGAGSLSGFRVNADGSLTPISVNISGLPATANALAAR